jgi:energy-coupling factor transport system ATP-binding protein
MISAKNLNFTYPNSDKKVLRRVNFEIRTGEMILVSGPTGSGKSTFLKTLNGLAPHFTGGDLRGSIVIDGVEVIGVRPHNLAHLVGYVNQQPETAFATDTVEEELAFGMEQLGFSRELMRQRVSSIAETLGLQPLLKRPLESLSGGQQQRVAIGAAISAGQKLLLLDEPTSALDSAGFDEVLALLQALARTNGITVILSEHRVARVLPHVDKVLNIRGDGFVTETAPEEFAALIEAETESRDWSSIAPASQTDQRNFPVFSARGITKSYDGIAMLGPIDLDAAPGTITTVTGENGSGKTTLLWCLLHEAWAQSVDVAMVPQSASDLLFLNTVSAELAEANDVRQPPQKQASRNLEMMVGRLDPQVHPRDLSSGEQLALVLAIQLNREAKLILLDEPTRGLDERARLALAKTLDELRRDGCAIILATHDLDFAASIADQNIELKQGRRLGEN